MLALDSIQMLRTPEKSMSENQKKKILSSCGGEDGSVFVEVWNSASNTVHGGQHPRVTSIHLSLVTSLEGETNIQWLWTEEQRPRKDEQRLANSRAEACLIPICLTLKHSPLFQRGDLKLAVIFTGSQVKPVCKLMSSVSFGYCLRADSFEKELTHLKRSWCWERLKAGREGDDRGWDGWMASPTRWTWAWVNSGSWWWTGRPGVLRFMGSQESDTTEPLNWTELRGAWDLWWTGSRPSQLESVGIWWGSWLSPNMVNVPPSPSPPPLPSPLPVFKSQWQWNKRPSWFHSERPEPSLSWTPLTSRGRCRQQAAPLGRLVTFSFSNSEQKCSASPPAKFFISAVWVETECGKPHIHSELLGTRSDPSLVLLFPLASTYKKKSSFIYFIACFSLWKSAHVFIS